MKRIITICAAILMTVSMFAQAPQKMSYQAVVRDLNSVLITSRTVRMQISVLQGSSTGTPVYVETQTPTTNANGLVSLEIGAGTTNDNFSNINWSAGPYFIKTETDPTGGFWYTITGTSELLSVPYALFCANTTSSSSTTYTIGLNADLGGYVLFVTPDGKHGLVAATQDQSISSSWFNAQNEISNPANHNADGKKFTDWRIPTKYELNLMSVARGAIGGFEDRFYWSSTLSDGRAFGIGFGGIWVSYDKMDIQDPHCVRAVRAF